ncbi:MAG: DUF3784 domain-containing protein [Bacteroidota bacterium]
MIIVLIALSCLFVAIGYMVTENNAKYLLSGYNTMTEEERKTFDLESYIPAFRKFHLFLGVSLLLPGVGLEFLAGEKVAGIFLVVYPLAAYIVFFWMGKKYYTRQSLKRNRIGIAILIATLVFVVALLFVGFKENKITITPGKISIEGMYGENLLASEIESVSIVDSLPEITLRTNGFALGNIRKGYFRTDKGERIKLLLNANHKPFLLILKKTGEKVYYSAAGNRNKAIFAEIQAGLPSVSGSAGSGTN